MISALDAAHNGTAEVIIAGNPDNGDTKRLVRTLQGSFLPAVTTLAVDPDNPDPVVLKNLPFVSQIKTIDGRSAAYVCRNFTCQPPVTDPDELIRILTGNGLNPLKDGRKNEE
jgi:uncharacterized protein YyaL (SSP411 family)